MNVSWRHMLAAPIVVVSLGGGLPACVQTAPQPAAFKQPASAPGEGFGYSYGSGGGYAATLRDK